MKHQAAWATDEAIGHLHRLWDAGVSIERIAELLHTSEGTVRGMARRIGCKPRRTATAEWATPEAIRRMRAEWANGTPLEEIGALLGVSKNAIAGMSYRLKLPQRPRRGGGPRPATTEPVSPALVATQPAPLLLAPSAPVVKAPRRVIAGPVRAPPPPSLLSPLQPLERPLDALRPVFAAPVKPVVIADPRAARIEPCCWVTQPSTSGRLPLYCDTPSMRGLPYCRDHARKAYPAVKQRLAEHASIGGDD